MLNRNARIVEYRRVLSQKRYVFIPRAKSTIKAKRNPGITKDNEVQMKMLQELDPYNVMKIEDSKVLEKKLKKLQTFTKDLKKQLSKSPDSLKGKYDNIDSIDNDDLDADADTIFQSLRSTNEHSNRHGNRNLKLDSSKFESRNLTELISQTKAEQAMNLVPETIINMINDNELIIKNLSNKTRQDWNPIIERLYQNKNDFQNLPRKTLKKFLSNHIHGLSFENINKLDELFEIFVGDEAKKFNFIMYSCLFENISRLPFINSNVTSDELFVNNPNLSKLKELVDRYDKTIEITPVTNRRFQTDRNKQHNIILNYCISYTSKSLNVAYVNYFLERFKKKYDVFPDKFTYTNIIQFYSRLNLPEKAWDTFDTMKFLSVAHAPDTKTYNTMLTICRKTKNYAKAIDLFHEMKDRKVTPNVETFSLMGSLLATCSSDNISAEGNDEALRLLGWKFISDMMNKDDLLSVGAMMSLAAYDGDVAVARALYFEYTMNQFRSLKAQGKDDAEAWQEAMNPILFNYLLLSYSKFTPQKLPLLLGWEEGRHLRRDLLNFADYTVRNYEDCSIILPFLPLIELNDINQIIMESNALWHFHVNSGSVNSDYLSYSKDDVESVHAAVNNANATDSNKLKSNILYQVSKLKAENNINSNILDYKCLLTYLTIPIRLSVKEEYVKRLKLYTFDQEDFVNVTDSIIQNKITSKKESSSAPSTQELTVNESQPEKYLLSLQHKLMMENSLYANCMKSAIQFHDSKFGSKIWLSRGKYRKSLQFKMLPMRDRIESDTEFAQLMINFFTEQRQYTDALSIILSSQRYINWTYPMVKPLHHALVELEDERSINKLLEIVNKKDPIKDLNLQIKELSL
ncbi:mitochondrial group I intron splicing factor Ccm1p [Monosporozyma unispora]